jgi:hypothetical protein
VSSSVNPTSRCRPPLVENLTRRLLQAIKLRPNGKKDKYLSFSSSSARFPPQITDTEGTEKKS